MVTIEKISVLIIFYNEEKKIEKTLESVLSMDYPKDLLEIVCVDDGSTDNSASIAGRYPVKLIKQERNGISSARNNGLKYCTGQYVMFLDAHIYLKNKNTFKIINDYFSKNRNIGGICGTYRSVLKSDKNFARDLRRIAIFKKGNYRKLINQKNFTTFSIAIGAFRRSLFEEIEFPENFTNSYGEDIFVQILIHRLGYDLAYFPEIIGLHDAQIGNLKIFSKMIFEVRGAGNIILNSDCSVKMMIPQLSFFLSYPLSLLFLMIACFISFHIFIVPCVLVCFWEFAPASRLFFVKKYSISEKIVAFFYLFLIEIMQMFYLPIYLLSRVKNFNQAIDIVKIIFYWEVKKIKNSLTL